MTRNQEHTRQIQTNLPPSCFVSRTTSATIQVMPWPMTLIIRWFGISTTRPRMVRSILIIVRTLRIMRMQADLAVTWQVPPIVWRQTLQVSMDRESMASETSSPSLFTILIRQLTQHISLQIKPHLRKPMLWLRNWLLLVTTTASTTSIQVLPSQSLTSTTIGIRLAARWNWPTSLPARCLLT